MRRSFEAYLWDVQDAGRQILAFVSAKTSLDYDADDLLRAAVERKFEVIGEALTQAKHHFPAEMKQIDDASQIIAFRNHLAHNYEDVNHLEVWTIIESDLPSLLQRVSVLLEPPEAQP